MTSGIPLEYIRSFYGKYVAGFQIFEFSALQFPTISSFVNHQFFLSLRCTVASIFLLQYFPVMNSLYVTSFSVSPMRAHCTSLAFTFLGIIVSLSLRLPFNKVNTSSWRTFHLKFCENLLFSFSLCIKCI